MCGRFVSATPPEILAHRFGARLEGSERAGPGPDAEPDYNVAPSKQIWVVRVVEGERLLDRARWGLVPPWADDPSIGNRMINARAESLAEKRSFKRPFSARRCVIPADGFYEWAVVPGRKRKQPWYIRGVDGAPLALAGLWETWRARGSEDEPMRTCTVVTCAANRSVSAVHDRMPVILRGEALDAWLDPDRTEPGELSELLAPAPDDALQLTPVGTAVNDPRSHGPELITEIQLDEAAGRPT